MAVTVKTVKKKRPLSLKKGGAPAEVPAEGAEGVAVAAPVAAAKPGKPVAPVKKASYKFAGVCAILEFLMFVAILTLQILEWKHYDAPPKGAFPRYGIKPGQIPIAGGHSAAAAPVSDMDAVGGDDFDDSDDFLADDEDFTDDAIDEEAIPAE